MMLPGREYRKLHSTLSGRSKIEVQVHVRGALQVATRDRQVGPSRSAMPLDLHHLSSICLIGSGRWVRKRKALFHETTEEMSKWVKGQRRPVTCRSPIRNSAATLR